MTPKNDQTSYELFPCRSQPQKGVLTLSSTQFETAFCFHPVKHLEPNPRTTIDEKLGGQKVFTDSALGGSTRALCGGAPAHPTPTRIFRRLAASLFRKS